MNYKVIKDFMVPRMPACSAGEVRKFPDDLAETLLERGLIEPLKPAKQSKVEKKEEKEDASSKKK